jgi:Ca2+:H+ antiporter
MTEDGGTTRFINVALLAYVAYLVFQLFSHTHLYHDRHDRQAVRFSLKAREKTLTPFSSETHQRIPSGDSITLDGRRSDNIESTTMIPPRAPFVLSRRFSTTSTVASRRSSVSSRPHDAHDPRRFNSNASDYPTTFETPSDATLRTNEGQEIRNDNQDVGMETTKEPRLSWFLTIFLLTAVTGVSSSPELYPS